MSRKKRVHPKRRVPDQKYSNDLVAMLINYVMKDGKRTTAEKVVYNAFDYIKEKAKQDPIEAFDNALRNVQPVLEVRAKRIGGANYQIPIEVAVSRKNILALRWLLGAARSRKGRPMGERLALEILDASKRQGGAVKKREDVHKMAEANRAFAHYA